MYRVVKIRAIIDGMSVVLWRVELKATNIEKEGSIYRRQSPDYLPRKNPDTNKAFTGDEGVNYM